MAEREALDPKLSLMGDTLLETDHAGHVTIPIKNISLNGRGITHLDEVADAATIGIESAKHLWQLEQDEYLAKQVYSDMSEDLREITRKEALRQLNVIRRIMGRVARR